MLLLTNLTLYQVSIPNIVIEKLKTKMYRQSTEKLILCFGITNRLKKGKVRCTQHPCRHQQE